MKKVIFFSILAILLFACKKQEFEPEGPTDVRVRNVQNDYTFYEVVINTAGSRDTTGNVKSLGTIAPGAVSEYARVAIAFSKAEITAKINGETFSTGPVNSTYMDYKGQMRITYEVYISDFNNKVLMISDVIPEEPLP
jgi:hypothetical protein